MIELTDVHKRFGSNEILKGVNLTVPDLENTVIIGYSGTGKSVLLKCIVGLLTPEQGTIAVDHRVVAGLDRDELADLRGRVGYVFQFAALFDSMTVEQNILLALRRRGLSEDEMHERVREALEMVRMEGTESKYPAELSGGMRKRVGLARAMALRPAHILYDEPTTGLDPVTSAVMNQLMVRTRDMGVTGVVVTHDMNSAFTVADRIAMLYEGSIRQVGTVDEMRNSDDPIVRQFIEGRPEPEATS
jgi:phospholipid/cholesterol/gamma-HCH transport system ATP-binding protein